MSTVRALPALLVAAALAGPAPAAVAEDFLGDAAIRTAFAGVTLDGVYAEGIFFTETYAADGTIAYVDRNGPNTGTWSVRDGMFCTFYQAQQGACFFVRRDGENCYAFFEPKAGAGGSKVPRDVWTSRGWDRARPSTCTETRKDSI
jgi:hypothetical protein